MRVLRTAIEKLWRIFISLRLTFVLLLIIAFGALLGMSVDQTLSYDEFYQNLPNSPFWASLFQVLELNDAFHSWWFSFAILLLSANLIACSIERLPRIFFETLRPRPYLTDRRLMGLKNKARFKVRSLEEGKQLIREFNKNLGKKKLAPDHYYFYQKWTLARFGVYVVHIALLIIMYSSIYATLMGVSGHVLINEGEKTRLITAKGAGGINYVHDLGFYVGCDDFRLKTFIDNSPMEYESDIFIENQDKKRCAQKTIRVNEPLHFNDFTFYQSSFRPLNSTRIVNLLVKKEKDKKNYQLKVNEKILLDDQITIEVLEHYEDFGGIGEAVRLRKIDGELDTYFHIFRKFPKYDEKIRRDNYNFTLLGTNQRYATGLSVAYVPGISIIFMGFSLLIVGVYMCFFMTPIRYFARIDENKDGTFVHLALQGYRNFSVVKKQFNEEITALKESFNKNINE